MKNTIRALGACLLLLSGLLGAPLALVHWGRYPPADWWRRLLVTDDGSSLLWLLTWIGWVAWALLAVTVAVEAVALLSRGRVRLRLPLLGGVQQVVAGLLLTIVALSAGSQQAAMAAPRAEGPVQASTPTTAHAPEPSSAAQGGQNCLEYKVQPGDDLWTLAERLLGDGGRWRKIAELNTEVDADPIRQLPTGARLMLPSDGVREIEVSRGDTLSGLAAEHLGTASRWPEVYKANRAIVNDPDEIDVGWRLVMPQRSVMHRGPVNSLDLPAQADPAPAPTPDPHRGPLPPDQWDLSGALVGGLGSLAAAMVLGTLGFRRRLQLQARPLGRRIALPSAVTQRYRTALGTIEKPDRLIVLSHALRAIGHHWLARGLEPCRPVGVVLGADGLTIEWGRAMDPPSGFTADGTAWALRFEHHARLMGTDGPCPFPALVTLGQAEPDRWALVDLERGGVFGLDCATDELREAGLAAILIELACAPWSTESSVVVVGKQQRLAQVAGGDGVRVLRGVGEAVREIEQLLDSRRDSVPADGSILTSRIDPDLSEAGSPVVYVLGDEVEAEVLESLDRRLASADLGVAVVARSGAELATRWRLGGTTESPHGSLQPGGLRLRAQVIAEPTRRAIAELLHRANATETVPAPWWSDETRGGTVRELRPAAPTVTDRAPEHPWLRMIGPIELRGAAGPEPARSRRQCEEYCGWLLENPGRTATTMADSLVVAEGTRRSNMSRLRTWLGRDADDQPYLPDAYSGRISLHPGVTSDWQRLQILVAPGVNRVGRDTLVNALELVHGSPLADAAPGQWHWADELRSDIASVIRDAGVLLVDQALTRRDIDLARWAGHRALLACPEDELLLTGRIRTEHEAGNRGEVERLVFRLVRQAKVLGIDLRPETVLLCQEVMEGQVRARMA